MKILSSIILLICVLACNSDKTDPQVKKLANEIVDKKMDFFGLSSDNEKMPELIHTVFFWLKKDLSESEIEDFEKSLKSLSKIESISAYFSGTPASTEDRDVVDNSFSYSLSLLFKDIESQNMYQKDSIHLKFIENESMKWDKVIVYDTNVGAELTPEM